MPVVPLGVDSRGYVYLINEGYDAISISKWKTSNHFPMVNLNVFFSEGKLLSLAKKILRV